MCKKITREKKNSECVAVVLTWISLGCESWSSLHCEIINAILNIAWIPKRQVHWTPTGNVFSLSGPSVSERSHKVTRLRNYNCSPHTNIWIIKITSFLKQALLCFLLWSWMPAAKVSPEKLHQTFQLDKQKQSCNSATGYKRHILYSNHKRLWLQKAQRLP